MAEFTRKAFPTTLTRGSAIARLGVALSVVAGTFLFAKYVNDKKYYDAVSQRIKLLPQKITGFSKQWFMQIPLLIRGKATSTTGKADEWNLKATTRTIGSSLQGRRMESPAISCLHPSLHTVRTAATAAVSRSSPSSCAWVGFLAITRIGSSAIARSSLMRVSNRTTVRRSLYR